MLLLRGKTELKLLITLINPGLTVDLFHGYAKEKKKL